MMIITIEAGNRISRGARTLMSTEIIRAVRLATDLLRNIQVNIERCKHSALNTPYI